MATANDYVNESEIMTNDDYRRYWDDLISVMSEEQVIRFMYRLSKSMPVTKDTVAMLKKELTKKEHEYSK